MTRLNLAYRVFDSFTDSFGQQIEAFADSHPDIEIVAAPWDPQDMYRKLVSGGGLANGDVDLMLTLSDWMPELIDSGAVQSLDEFIDVSPPPDWPEGWSPSLRELQTDGDGSTYGIAYHNGPMMLLYRGDLFEDERERTGFQQRHGRELLPPETWNEFIEVAHWFNRPEDGLAGASLGGLPDGHNNVYDFFMLLWTRGGRILDDANLPVFNSAAGIAALQFYVDLVHTERVVPLECLEHDSVSSGDYYAAGRSAMMWNWSGFSAITELDSSRIRGCGRLGLIPKGDGPEGIHATLNVYWLIALSVQSSDRDAAWEFMRHLASPEMDLVTAWCGGIGTRLSTWRHKELGERFPTYGLTEAAHRGARTLPALGCYPQINDVISEMTRVCMHEHRDVGEALLAATHQVDQIVHDAGVVRR